jgi:phosphohistidine phosphatase
MDLYIIRHAWAADRDDRQWPADDLRPLTAEGKRRFAEVVDKLAERGMVPQAVATSPLVRCRQTAELVVAGVAGKPELVELDELRPGSDLKGLLRWAVRQARQHEQIAWVGHAPDVDWLAAALIGSPEGQIRFAKGAVAAIRFDESPTAGGGELQWLVTAKVLGC